MSYKVCYLFLFKKEVCEVVRIVIFAFLTMLISLIITPIFIRLVKKFNVTDKPNHRKVHKDPIPTRGGLRIFLRSLVGLATLQPPSPHELPTICGALTILAYGRTDECDEPPPQAKCAGQTAAALPVAY